MNKGWIRIDRKILDHFLWMEKPFSKGQAWIDLILLANHEDKTIIFNGSLLEIKRGERLTSIKQLSSRWSWSTTKTVNFLNLLEKEKMLEKKSDTKKTVLTIVNYGVYQDLPNEKKMQKNFKKETEKFQKNTNNNDKQCNNNEETNTPPTAFENDTLKNRTF